MKSPFALDAFCRVLEHYFISDQEDAYLARSVDLADLERRQRVLQQRTDPPRHFYW